MRRPVDPPLLAEMLEKARLRAITPTNEPVSLSDEDRQEIDAAIHAYKQPRPGNPLVDGYEADRQRRAIAMEQGSRRHS